MQTLKTYAEWQESGQQLTPFLSPGDPVDNEFVDWAIEVLPPATFSGTIVQIGEPHSHVDGRATFATFVREFGLGWKFAGYCHRGKTFEPEKAK